MYFSKGLFLLGTVIYLAEGTKHCDPRDPIVEILEGCEKKVATAFCSAFLHIPKHTKTITKTLSTTKIDYTKKLVRTLTHTVSTKTSVELNTITSTTVVGSTETDSTTTTTTTTTTSSSTVTLAPVIGRDLQNRIEARKVSLPPYLYGKPSSAVSSACSCLAIPKATTTITKTVTHTLCKTKTSLLTSWIRKTKSTTSTKTIDKVMTSTSISTVDTTRIVTSTTVTTTIKTVSPVSVPTCLAGFFIQAIGSPVDQQYAKIPFANSDPANQNEFNWAWGPLDSSTAVFNLDSLTGFLTSGLLTASGEVNTFDSGNPTSYAWTYITMNSPGEHSMTCSGTDFLQCSVLEGFNLQTVDATFSTVCTLAGIGNPNQLSLSYPGVDPRLCSAVTLKVVCLEIL